MALIGARWVPFTSKTRPTCVPLQRYDILSEGGEVPRVPGHLGEALEALEQDEVVRSALPGRLYDVYMHYKRDEWQRFLGAVTDWERDRYLDVLP